jgi:hypothetical protein
MSQVPNISNNVEGRKFAADLHAVFCSIGSLEDTGHSEELQKLGKKLRKQTFDKFLEEGPLLTVSGRPFYCDNTTLGGDCYLIDKKGFIIELGRAFVVPHAIEDTFDLAKNGWQDDDQFVGVVVQQGKKLFALLSGDEREDANTNPLGENENSITISFECLRRFYEKKKISDVARRLVSGSIELIDWDSDDWINLTAAETNTLHENGSAYAKLTPPKAGYTLIGEAWHRAATALLYDHEQKFTILLGQDEDAYFGVELADNPKTIQAAYTSLMPKAARNVKGVKRQGEWFAVPVAQKDVPDVSDCIFEATITDDESFWLNRDSEESARHYLQSNDIRIGKDGIVYAHSIVLSHQYGEHEAVCCRGWVAFHRNTAKRSFSVQGVD